MSYQFLWLLLLPIAAASGWWAARRSEVRARPALKPEYYRGLNFLLNEQPDKAIEIFVKMAEVDSTTVDPHFALGNLFRRQGEVDRAIRIHQNLIARPTLTREQHNQALFELAQDYLQAGLLDRAENLFRELISRDRHNVAALRQLNSIYEQEREWEKAISVAQDLQSRTGESQRAAIAQYYCELAQQALDKDLPVEAKRLIKRALASDRDCVRASILFGDIERANGNCKAAIKAYKRLEQQDNGYLSEVLEALLQCYEVIGRPTDVIPYLEGALQRQAAIQPVITFARFLARHTEDAVAVEFLAAFLERHPSLPGVSFLLQQINEEADQGAARGHLARLQDILGTIVARLPLYLCQRCGFKGQAMHWQCPSCRSWNCVRPYQDLTV